MKIYLASSLFNIPKVQLIRDDLISQGHQITYDWTIHGQLSDLDELKQAGINETQGVKDCDLLFMVTPARLGTHVELGIAIALNKPIIILAEGELEMKPFYLLDNVTIFKRYSEALNHIIIKERSNVDIP
jgi:nucleoside 2-deoxyribosyltransferase